MTTPKKRVYYSKGNFVTYKNERYIVVSANYNYLFTVYTLMNVTSFEIVLVSSLDENLNPIRKRAFYDTFINLVKNANYSKEYKAQKLEDEVLGDVL